MASILRGGRSDAAPADATAPAATRPTLTATDLVAGGPVVVLAVVATMSLAWAHAHRHSLAAVLLSSALVLAVLTTLVARLAKPRIKADRAGVAAVLGAGVLAAVMFLPGFSYGVSEKDPGGYVAHGVAIAREDSYSFIDPALAHPTLPVVHETPYARFPGIWVRHTGRGLIVPQFFHLWPALFATMYDIAGFGGITATTPIVGIAAVMVLVGLLRRVGGMPAAVVGGLLLSTNMLQVWQAKYPTTEVFAQALFVAALFFVVVAAQQRWRPAAFLAGLMVGVGFLNRADGWLLVMLAAVTIGAVWMSRRADGEAAWGAAGLAVVLPYGLWQAYAAARTYTLANFVPDLRPTLGLLALAAATAVAGRVLLRRPVGWTLETFAKPRVQRIAGVAVCALYGALVVLAFLRPRLFGEDYTLYGNIRRIRSYDEQNMRRLSWFFTVPGIALAWLGLAVVALRRWRTAAWAVVLPTLLLMPLFVYEARNSTRLMWSVRRYVSNVVPGLVVLMALALGFAMLWRWKGRRVLAIPAVAATLALTATFLSQSLPLRSHDEWGGSFGVAEQVSKLAGDGRGVFLWQRAPHCCAAPTSLWATPVWLERGELSVLLPSETWLQSDYVREYKKAFPDDPVFVVWTGAVPPPAMKDLNLQPLRHFQGTLPFWEEHDEHRPRVQRQIPYSFVVYRVP